MSHGCVAILLYLNNLYIHFTDYSGEIPHEMAPLASVYIRWVCVITGLILILSSQVSCQDAVMKQTVKVNTLGVPVSINCLPNDQQPTQGDKVKHWVLNDNTTVSESTGGVTIDRVMWTLIIENLRWASYGKYYCYVEKADGRTFYVTTELETNDHVGIQ